MPTPTPSPLALQLAALSYPESLGIPEQFAERAERTRQRKIRDRAAQIEAELAKHNLRFMCELAACHLANDDRYGRDLFDQANAALASLTPTAEAKP